MGQLTYMKISLIAGAVAIIALTTIYFTLEPKALKTEMANSPDELATTTPTDTEISPTDGSRLGRPDSPSTTPADGKIKADMFRGTLQAVNTGCFSDGECFVMVDGKHITILMGWSRDTVGTIIGAPSIGDLEAYIGKPVEVYARVNTDKTYTLYGSEGFYVKVLSSTASTTTPVTKPPTAGAACVVGGCSAQLCVDPTEEPTVSTCIYKEQYACYKTAECKRQTSGQCGWTETSTLKSCLAKPSTTTDQPQ